MAAPARGRRFGLVLVALLLGGLLVSLLPAAGLAAPPATPTPVTTGVPRFEPGPCAYTLPKDQQEGKTVVCGYAVVPERHENPKGKTIKLPVAVYKARGAAPQDSAWDKPAAEPIILLAGGPGQSDQVFATLLTASSPYYRGLTATHDVVIFDQRGTGKAQPSLACPELTSSSLGGQVLVQALDTQSAFVAAALRCRDRLAGQGIDLAAYTTTENAADVNDVRAVLGYPAMDLYGGSYGSALGLAVERDFPGVVHAAVLESIVPPQVAWIFAPPQTFDRVLHELFRACAADAACNTTYPDLQGAFQRGVARLNATPARVQVTDPASGETVGVPVTGTLYSQLLFNLFYVTQVIPYLPDMIARVDRGDTAFLGVLLPLLLQPGEPLSYGMHFSAACSGNVSTQQYQQALAADAKILPEARAALEPTFVRDYYAICQQWPSRGADPKSTRPAASTVPTLLVSGQFDPITPPAYADLARESLPHSTGVVLPGGGHTPTFAIPCGFNLALAFVANPGAAPDTSCVAQLGVTFKPLPAELAGGPAPSPSPSPSPAPMPGLPNTGSGGAMAAVPDAGLPLFLGLIVVGVLGLGLGARGPRARGRR
ncbi:MAG TPA: alpha/beta hydrolase [Thermomicrobiales bacterium]|nr:alpha/beta hydrolase [Thermomicrobiales bacterium]